MNCTICNKPDSSIPPDHTEPMCHACWCQHTEEGKQWWENEQRQDAYEDEMNRAIEEEYYRRQPDEAPDQYLTND